ncbi:MAG: MFS transporter [Nocardioidaceae bacterium]
MSDIAATPSPAVRDDRGDHGHKHLGIALALISAAQLMVVLDATIVNIALPHLQSDLGFSASNLTWVVNAYTLTFGGLLLLGGRMGDLLGRRKVFVFGVVLFAVASLVGGLAQNETMMLAARVAQGIGAAAASPTALSLITTTFPAGPSRNRAFGVYAAMSGAGAAVGLILGGALTEFDWRLTFFINVPIGLGVAALAPKMLGESARQRGRFDLPGAVTATVGLVGIVYGLTHKALPNATWTQWQTLVPLLGGLALVLIFLAIESRSPHALLPLRILADRTRAVSFFVMLVVGAAMFSMFYFIGLYIQNYLGYSSLKTGFAFLPFSIGVVVAAQVASTLMSRVDPRWISGVGAVFMSLGMVIFHFVDHTPAVARMNVSPLLGANLSSSSDTYRAAVKSVGGLVDTSYWTGVLPGIMVLSFGMGLIFVPLTLTAVSRIAHEDSGVGSAVLNTMQQVGGALGLAMLGTIAANSADEKIGSYTSQAAGVIHGRLPDQISGLLGTLLAQPTGYVAAFAVSFFLIIGSAVVIVVGLNASHEEIAADGKTPEPVAVG